MKTYVPSYYSHFACIADRCRHSCCCGWEIDIDETTLSFYRQLSGSLGEKLLSSIVEDEDGAHFVLDEKERCPFLTEKGLCELILTLGEDSLCEICTDHPRFRNYFSDRTELGLGLCCEAAGRLVLGWRERVTLTELPEPFDANECAEREDSAAEYTEADNGETADTGDDDGEAVDAEADVDANVYSEADGVVSERTEAEETALLSLRAEWMACMQDRRFTVFERAVRLAGRAARLSDTNCKEYAALPSIVNPKVSVSCPPVTNVEESIALPLVTNPQEQAALLLPLERLDENWTEVLHHLETLPAENAFGGVLQAAFSPEAEIALEQWAVYLLFRHVPSALEDGDAAARLAFCLFVLCTVANLFLLQKREKGNLTLEDCVETCRLFSSEIEYSQENTDALLAAL